ncbi:Uncharacterized protein FKW44_023094 [Caligus rogercresseyi]|uniref:Uncharacterized protein n=1 Tax=Caligus rogercresseyi TaxID=217165 RepID=A0A7T8GPA6_CALRO|nr:Uncharacterized protein FKW44_023094 [Caligus rogercresseyi]
MHGRRLARALWDNFKLESLRVTKASSDFHDLQTGFQCCAFKNYRNRGNSTPPGSHLAAKKALRGVVDNLERALRNVRKLYVQAMDVKEGESGARKSSIMMVGVIFCNLNIDNLEYSTKFQ